MGFCRMEHALQGTHCHFLTAQHSCNARAHELKLQVLFAYRFAIPAKSEIFYGHHGGDVFQCHHLRHVAN